MFKLTIRTPYETVFSGEVEAVQFVSEEGELGVHENHADLTASIKFTQIIVEEGMKIENFLARRGTFLFDNDQNEASFLLAYCEKESEVDHKTAEEYVAFLTKQLEEGENLSSFQLLYLEGERLAVEEQLKTQS